MELMAMARLCGLTEADLTRFLPAPRRRIAKWLTGEASPSNGALEVLRDLHERQQATADGLIAAWLDAGRPDSIDFTVGADDESAEKMGWPSPGAQMAVAAIAQVEIAPSRVIARPVAVKGERLDPVHPAAIAAE